MIVLTIGLVFTSCDCKAQELNGIGRLKLGMRVSDIPELKNSKIITSETPNFLDKNFSDIFYWTNREQIYELRPDTTKDKIYGYYTLKARMFLIPKMEIFDGVWIEEVRLSFYNDSLFEIQCRFSDQLESILSLKYNRKMREFLTDLDYVLCHYDYNTLWLSNITVDNIVENLDKEIKQRKIERLKSKYKNF